MNWELILAWLGMGVLTDYTFYRLGMQRQDLTLLDLLMLLGGLVWWPSVLLVILFIVTSSITIIRRRDR